MSGIYDSPEIYLLVFIHFYSILYWNFLIWGDNSILSLHSWASSHFFRFRSFLSLVEIVHSLNPRLIFNFFMQYFLHTLFSYLFATLNCSNSQYQIVFLRCSPLHNISSDRWLHQNRNDIISSFGSPIAYIMCCM